MRECLFDGVGGGLHLLGFGADDTGVHFGERTNRVAVGIVRDVTEDLMHERAEAPARRATFRLGNREFFEERVVAGRFEERRGQRQEGPGT